MDRLTMRTAAGTANLDYPKGTYHQDGQPDRIAQSAYRQLAIERLAAYEDLGLSPDEIEKTLYNFSGFLCEMTGGRLSKTNYPIRTMIAAANDYQQRICDEDCEKSAELRALSSQLDETMRKGLNKEGTTSVFL